MGAATGTLISEVVLFTIFYSTTRKIIPYKLNLNDFFKLISIFGLTVIFALTLKAFGLYFLLGIAAALILFYLFVYLFDIINIETLKSLTKD
jgi:hypothetical protein